MTELKAGPEAICTCGMGEVFSSHLHPDSCPFSKAGVVPAIEHSGADFLTIVQEKSVSRANRWHGGDFRQWSGLEWAGAMCGEAGEAANVAKKLRRVELEIDGNAASERKLVPAELVEKLAGECADTLLYLSLLASRYDINLKSAVVKTFNKKSIEMGFPEML